MPLAKRAQKLGIDIVLCDFRNIVPCMEIASFVYHGNTLNPQDVIDIIKKEQVDGVITNSEPTFRSMAISANETGLRCLSIETTELFKNKYLMRDFCSKHNIPSPRYALCTKLDEAITFFRQLGKKVIIKPLDNSASRGVYSINSESELREHFQDCMDYSSEENKSIIIEEYIQGTEFTIDGIKCKGKHNCISISEKKHYAYNENVAYQLLFSNTNENFDYDLLRKTNDYLVEQTDMEFGITHAEYKYQDGQFYLIEIQARGGGNHIATDIDPFISGLDPYELQIEWCVGKDVNIAYDYNHLSNRCSVLYFFDAPSNGGIVKEIAGLEFMDSIEGLDYHLNFGIGDRVEPAINDSKRIGYYIMKAQNRDQLNEVMREIDNRFKIIY